MPQVPTNSFRPRCYIASPLGFTEGGMAYYRETYLPALARVVEPVDPWALTTADEVAAAAAEGRGREMSLEIGRRNIEAIRSSEMLVAYLEGQEPDSGTVVEIGYAAGLGLSCFGIRSDFREAGESGVVVNLQVETIIVESGGEIVSSLSSLVTVVERYALRELRARPQDAVV